MAMRARVVHAVVLIGLWAVSGAVHAQKVYKCTDASGKVTFQQASCPGKNLEEGTVRMHAAPKVSEDDRIRDDAYRAGRTPAEADRLVEEARAEREYEAAESAARREGRMSVVDADRVRLKCTAADGGTYYRSGAEGCGTAPSPSRPPQQPLQPQRLQRRDDPPNARELACEEARKDAQEARDQDMDLGFDERRKLDDRVYERCKPEPGGFR
jgi:hypothetical protein